MTEHAQEQPARSRFHHLDSVPGASLDRILSLSQRVLGVSRAAVLLETAPGQWAPSVRERKIREPTPVMSFCAEKTPDASVLVIEDVREHDEFRHHLSDASSHDVRFCAGAPLVTIADERLGTLCLTHEAPRILGEEARTTLETLTDIIVNLLEVQTLNAEIGYLKSALRQAHDAVVITEAGPLDAPGPRIVWANEAFSQMTGYDRNEVVGESPRILQGPDTDRSVLNKVRSALECERSVHAETVNYRKDGTPYVVAWHISPVYDEHGDLTHWVSIQRDVTDEQRREERLKHEAKHDALTGLPNRYAIQKEIQSLIDAPPARRGLAVLLYVDLDEFKPVNDKFGHKVGDQVLIRTADVLRSEVRRKDALGRIGGDEFVVCLSALDRVEEARAIAERLAESLGQSVTIGPHEIQVDASIGGAVELSNFETAEEALHTADTAMYRAKDDPHQTVVLWEEPVEKTPTSTSLPV